MWFRKTQKRYTCPTAQVSTWTEGGTLQTSLELKKLKELDDPKERVMKWISIMYSQLLGCIFLILLMQIF